MNREIQNLQWIQKGRTGCTFATLFSKSPDTVGWKFMNMLEWMNLHETLGFEKDCLIVSIVFDEMFKKEDIRRWALQNGFYEENTSENTVGLRHREKEGISWVQYFGPDSHVVTRRTPYPMLMYTRKLNKSHYIKVGFNGLLHLAHAWYDKISDRVYDLLWQRSYKQTSKILGHAPTIVEAAKTTWLKDGNNKI